VREDARQRAAEFVKELYAAGAIDADRLGTSVDKVLAARSEIELAGVIRSLPAPVTLTSQERQLARPLEIHSGVGRLRLAGKPEANLGSLPGERSAEGRRPTRLWILLHRRQAATSRLAGRAMCGYEGRPVTVSAAAAKAGSPVAACPRWQASTSFTWCGSRLRTAATVRSLPGGRAG